MTISCSKFRLYPPRTEFHFFEIVIAIICINELSLWVTSLSFCDEGFGTRYSKLWFISYKGGSRHKNLCMTRVLGFLIGYFSNYYTLHRSDLAAWAAPLDPRLSHILEIKSLVRSLQINWICNNWSGIEFFCIWFSFSQNPTTFSIILNCLIIVDLLLLPDWLI